MNPRTFSFRGDLASVNRYFFVSPYSIIGVYIIQLNSFSDYLAIVDRYSIACLYSGRIISFGVSSDAAAVHCDTTTITPYSVTILTTCLSVYGTALDSDSSGTVQSITTETVAISSRIGRNFTVVYCEIIYCYGIGPGKPTGMDRPIGIGSKIAIGHDFAVVYRKIICIYGSGIVVFSGIVDGSSRGRNFTAVYREVICIYGVGSRNGIRIGRNFATVYCEMIDVYCRGIGTVIYIQLSGMVTRRLGIYAEVDTGFFGIGTA